MVMSRRICLYNVAESRALQLDLVQAQIPDDPFETYLISRPAGLGSANRFQPYRSPLDERIPRPLALR